MSNVESQNFSARARNSINQGVSLKLAVKTGLISLFEETWKSGQQGRIRLKKPCKRRGVI